MYANSAQISKRDDLHYSLQTLRQDPARFARETLSLTLDVIPVVGFFTFADEALAAGRLVDHLADNADLAADLLKSSKELGHLDEGAGLVKHLDDGLLKQLPEASDGQLIFAAEAVNPDGGQSSNEQGDGQTKGGV